MASVLDQYDRDAYEPIYGRDADGNKGLIGVRRRPQDEIDRRRTARLLKEAGARPQRDRMNVGE